MAVVRFAAFSCLHAPITDPKYFNWLCDQLSEYRPDVIVNLGDWYEGLAGSRHSRHPLQKWSLYDEHRAVLAQAQRLRAAVPEAKKVWLFGNHDDNQFGRQPDRVPEDLREVADWRNYEPLRDELSDWRIIDTYTHRTAWYLGQVAFQHGCAVGLNAQADAACAYGVPYGLHVSGHTHRPARVTQVMLRQVPLPYWFANPGTGIDFDQTYYMDRQSMLKWGHGLVLGECKASGEGRQVFAARNWDAETRVFKMAHDGVTI